MPLKKAEAYDNVVDGLLFRAAKAHIMGPPRLCNSLFGTMAGARIKSCNKRSRDLLCVLFSGWQMSLKKAEAYDNVVDGLLLRAAKAHLTGPPRFCNSPFGTMAGARIKSCNESSRDLYCVIFSV